MNPALHDLLASARVVSLPLVTRFRGIDTREAVLFHGPNGWTEFSPFVEYEDAESASWLAAAIDFGWGTTPTPLRDRIHVNATLPAVGVSEVEAVLARFPGCRTVKVKVAEVGGLLADDVARVARVRELLGPDGRIRVDANGGWNVDEAETAIHAFAPYDLEYVEQPCASVEELAEIRVRVKYMGIPIAADESVRKAEDPLLVARAGAANILVLKAQPLGGVAAALNIVRDAGLPVVISSALDTSVGLSMGAFLAASVPELDFDCGLGTAALLAADVTDAPLVAVDGQIEVRRVDVSDELLDRHAASAERTAWWLARVERCHALLAG
ncbi:O-succinylbenzoate synthase [Glaciihabitans tibetensis]|uniref:o-succinylbenzoate synthase n=1 Tax=Glaciihabitans tibetensis TaxID=1266600 RepID=A0A2T0VA52_9MICO|nr:o-succinylbenzoate synthase [Glaciihabitans tibetensis]PRY67033.1 O-succinylbenzoate synthase [Glaciihabitans tibetensis]